MKSEFNSKVWDKVREQGEGQRRGFAGRYLAVRQTADFLQRFRRNNSLPQHLACIAHIMEIKSLEYQKAFSRIGQRAPYVLDGGPSLLPKQPPLANDTHHAQRISVVIFDHYL